MVTQGLIFKKNPIYEKCPSCTSIGSLRKSHSRSIWEKIIKMLLRLVFTDVKNVAGVAIERSLY